MKKIIVSRDDSIYEAWPDVAILPNGRMVCVFSECTHHGNRDMAKLVTIYSDDEGNSWSEKRYLTEAGTRSAYFNCARISTLHDGRLVIISDFIKGNENGHDTRNFLWFSEDGINWGKPLEIPIFGIVPCFRELQSGRWLAATHHLVEDSGKLGEYCIFSDDKGKTWSDIRVVASDSRYNLCEVSFVEVESNVVVGYMRENSFMGWDCFKSISYDGGETWNGVYNVPLPGCHRPVAGLLRDGSILITYRFLQGGQSSLGNFMQNAFGALMSHDSALETERNRQSTRIFPIDYDRSPVADIGYTGWAQLKNGDIYIVDYLVDDAPKAWIQASVISMEDIIVVDKKV